MSRTVALQDLAFYSNGSVFSENAVSLVTSTYEIMPTWLVHSLLSLILGRKTKGPEHVVLISFLDRSQLYNRALLKTGIDLNRKKVAAPGSAAPFTHVDLSKLLTEDLAVIQSTIEKNIKSAPESTCILFENPDLLLPLGRSSEAVLEFASSLQKRASNIFFFCQADDELLVDSPVVTNSLEARQNGLLLGLLYRSQLSLAVRPLSTGRANDVTGTLIISKGPLCTDDSVQEDSYQYLVSGDTVKLFYR